MPVVKADGHTPFKGAAADAEILKPRKQEVVEHLFCAGCGLNKFGVSLNVFDKAGRIFADVKEIAFFLNLFNLAAAIGAHSAALLELRLRPERLAGRAIHALVAALINIALIIELFKDLLNACNVVIIRRANKAVVGNIHKLPKAVEPRNDVVNILLRCNSRFRCLAFNLLSVFVRTGQKVNIIAAHSLIACKRVRVHGAIGVSDMQFCTRIVNGRCDVISFLFFHDFRHKNSPSEVFRIFAF